MGQVIFLFFSSDSSDRQGGQIHFIAYAKPRHPSCCTEPRNRFWLDTCTLLFELSSFDLAELWCSRLIHSQPRLCSVVISTHLAPNHQQRLQPAPALSRPLPQALLYSIRHLPLTSRIPAFPKSLALEPRFYLDRAAIIEKASISTRANSLRVA